MAKRIYIAGPMRGYPEFNFPAFHAAAAKWRALGWEVVNPAEVDIAEGQTSKDGEPVDSGGNPLTFHDYMQRDLPLVLSCDAIALLPYWWQSEGAATEAYVAWATGKKLFENATGEPLYVHTVHRPTFEWYLG